MRLSCAVGLVASAVNMNGKYLVGTGDKMPVDFNDDYASKGHEYFDVWSPEIATHYGEVFWTSMGTLPLPEDIVQRFDGKAIAVTGYEMDQVMVEPTGQPGLSPEKDVSVPINWAYNHHYMTWMTGKHSKMQEIVVDPEDTMAHGAPTMWVALPTESASFRKDPSIPVSQFFSEGNGGESRKSFHGYPKGFAQLVDSPTSWTITPMQIDTRNRDCGVSPSDINNCTVFTPGPEPKQARFGRPAPLGTNYSGLLECPCTSRYAGDSYFYPDAKTKQLHHMFEASAGTCQVDQHVASAELCFEAGPALGINATQFINRTITNASMPPACSVAVHGNGSATVYYNTKGNGTCNGAAHTSGASTTSRVNVTLTLDLNATGAYKRSPKGVYCSNNHASPLAQFIPESESVADAVVSRMDCENWCIGNRLCWGCSVHCPSSELCQWNAIKSCGTVEHFAGKIKGDITQRIGNGTVTITTRGPADVWFGVGINASEMADAPYALISNGSGIMERQIGTCGSEAEHCPGDLLTSSVTVVSNTVEDGMRTILMTRPFAGLTDAHHSFHLGGQTNMNLITAVGSSQVFAYHKAHGPAQITLSSAGSATCVCDVGIQGDLCETGGENCGHFVKDCAPAPFGDLVTQKNPTCSSATYGGGLRCCTHKRILLDTDQEIRPELLRYHMKFRFWFQDYTKDKTGSPTHYNLDRIYYQTEANAGEYDVPPAFSLPGEEIPGYGKWPANTTTPGTSCTGQCPDGADCECVHTITYHWNVSNIRLLYAGGHCHAPSCLSIELFRNDTGTPQLLCRQLPVYGNGTFPVDKWDEAGYVTLPPCLWGSPEEGLEEPVFLPENTPLISIKKNRNTHLGHYGEMASWQMRGVSFPAESRGVFV
mmetsp:Transcript_58745/g.128742  ORF Transcript_58745/g.128742 Transcript_58745/m.128742 type:complete len:880 (+) Transcript_58745:49-2688(+)|eukprot:CAMPEP_0204320242 /NCGR_PEP_ID=MMETSP0469-20131031/7543_1 /ASSEMBLY_ACC=CAM_ASM_000384 /TAXON_ID=2969 /ORGANISM="Oxyrrhis marina" /LENGTH=879 /DNA_ID=CAMNT_0051301505 /DNA_START=33 /DNA_END=2672 /DNA_ORIENTATION=-